ncbi:hypothetical protein, partial [Microbacterium sp. gxy059]|uniref:hypothetical protein n=1 Tax=Microbacterium sp. gxy059 TaxID=2957199 RepID=UPI003D97BAEB
MTGIRARRGEGLEESPATPRASRETFDPAPTTGSVSVVASETFGWIDPAVADRPLTRRELREHHTRLAITAMTFAIIGLAVSWFGPWGAAPALVGLVLGVVAAFRPTESRVWTAASIATGAVAIAFSASWLLWIL